MLILKPDSRGPSNEVGEYVVGARREMAVRRF